MGVIEFRGSCFIASKHRRGVSRFKQLGGVTRWLFEYRSLFLT